MSGINERLFFGSVTTPTSTDAASAAFRAKPEEVDRATRILDMLHVTPYERYFDAPLKGEGAESRWFAYMVYVIGTIVLKAGFRFTVEGRENLKGIPDGGAAVLAVNHASFLDPLLIVQTLDLNARFIAREDLFDNVFAAQFLARMGAFPIKRDSADRKAIKRAVAALKRGEHLGIFPEGTRIRFPGQKAENHAGAVLIARMANAPIVPVGIEGSDRVKPYGSKILHFPTVHVRFGAPVWPSAYDDIPKKERAQFMIDDVMRKSYALRDGVPYETHHAPTEDAEKR